MIQSAGVAIVDLNLEDPTAEATVLCVRAYANWDFPKGQLEEERVTFRQRSEKSTKK